MQITFSQVALYILFIYLFFIIIYSITSMHLFIVIYLFI